MAVHRKTQKSIGNYDAKFLGPFTARQSLWMGIGLVPSVFIGYNEYLVGLDLGIILITVAVIMAVPLFMAFGEKVTYGMKPEDFARQYYRYRILAPKVRVSKTETYDDVIYEKKQKEEAAATESGTKKTSKSKETNVVRTKNGFKEYAHKISKDYPEFL